jgi:hypothetical protein
MKYNNIEFSNCGYSLEELGIHDRAFSKEDALKIISEVEKFKKPILGGDVLELKGGKIQYNYDNWYCDKFPNELQTEYLKRSIDRAKEYITQYKIGNIDNILFALVLG